MAPAATALQLPAPKNSIETNVGEATNGGGVTSSKTARVEDVSDELTAQSTSSAALRYATGGVIYPPPELRSIVDKTAQYVARNGIEFESKIRGDAAAGSNRLAFLNDDDTFNSFYRAKLEALTSGTGPLANVDTINGGDSTTRQDTADAQSKAEKDGEGEDKLTEPEPFQFSAELPSITSLDLDIIKLTALFVAKRGRSFASALAAREGKSYQFEFLRPSHSMFGFYNRLVEQYRLVMNPSPAMLKQIRFGAFGSEEEPVEGAKPIVGMGKGGARLRVMDEICMRANWERWERAKRKLEQDEEDKERAAFDEIDWQDFVVVGTAELTEQDEHIDLPPPMSLKEVRNMSMAQRRMAAAIMEGEDVSEDEEREEEQEQQASTIDVEMGKGKDEASAKPDTPSVPSKAGASMKIRKDYQPKTLAERRAAAAAQATTCPVCGQSVALAEMDEHVRIELANPQYREQRRELESKRAQHSALMEGADPSKSLRQFAGKRSDIFGGAAEEEAQRKREQDEARKRKERESMVWDGHAASRMDTTNDFNRPEALQSEMEQMQKRFKTDQVKTYAGPQGVEAHHSVPPSMPLAMQGQVMHQVPPTPFYASGQQQQQQQQHQQQRHQYQHQYGMQNVPPGYEGVPYGNAPAYSDAQHATYQLDKRTDGVLYPEQQWLQYHPHLIRLVIQLPDARSVSEQCDGKQVTFDALPMTTTIGALRDRVQSETLNGSVGASRLKLRVDGKATTLRQTLAYWNLVDSDVLTLLVG